MKFFLVSTLLVTILPSNIAPSFALFYRLAEVISVAQRNSAETIFQQGRSKYEQRKIKEAITSFDKAINLKSDFVQAYVYRGLAYKKLGKLKEAINDYTQALNLSSNDRQFQSLIHYNRGLAYSDLRKIQDAINDFTLAIQLNPKDADAYYQRGFILSEKSDIRGAIADFSNAIKVNPSHLGAYVQRGIVYNSYFGDVLKATDDFMKAVRLKPNDADDYWNLGSARSATGNLKGALDAFNQAISRSPNYSRAYSSRAGVKYLLGDNKAAIADVDQAIKIMKDQKRPDVNSLFTLATISANNPESEQDRLKTIYDLANKAIQDSPEDAQGNLLLYLARGNISTLQKNTKEALSDFELVIKESQASKDEFPIALYLRAILQPMSPEDKPISSEDRITSPVAQQKPLEDLSKAIILSPNFAQAYFARGYLYQQLKDLPSARADFSKAIAIYTEVIRQNPNSLDAYVRRRRIYRQVGNSKDAESDLLQVVKLRGKLGIKQTVSSCDKQRVLASFRDSLSCQ